MYKGGGIEAARALELNSGTISRCVNKKRHQTGGYEFEFSDPTEVEMLENEEWREVGYLSSPQNHPRHTRA